MLFATLCLVWFLEILHLCYLFPFTLTIMYFSSLNLCDVCLHNSNCKCITASTTQTFSEYGISLHVCYVTNCSTTMIMCHYIACVWLRGGHLKLTSLFPSIICLQRQQMPRKEEINGITFLFWKWTFFRAVIADKSYQHIYVYIIPLSL